MKRLLVSFALVTLVSCYGHAEEHSAFWPAFWQTDQLEDRALALKSVETLGQKYPEHEDVIRAEMAQINVQLGRPQESVKIWKEGHQKGLFFGLSPLMDWLKPLQNLPELQQILDRDKELREQADRGAKMRYEVVTPSDYSPQKKYPVFLVLHGGAGDIEQTKLYWHSPVLSSEYLTVYIQSNLHGTSNTFTWRPNTPELRAGIRKLYDEVAAKYPIDETRVLIGGMSAGGMMSLDVIFHEVLPVTGFVVNCPVVPYDFQPEMADKVRQRGIRGVIITGEKDFALTRQKEMAQAFTKAGVRHRFTIVPGMGHSVPDDFPSRMDAALLEVTPPGQPVAGKCGENFVFL